MGQVTAMTINPADFAHIQSVLTDLYSDPMLAVLREYSTNARDAQTAAGVTRPIEVNLPSQLRNSLTIRDFGTGMSVSELQETYGMFGASTKRESNAFNGCLGLGSKSALTYAPTFTVSSVKDGVKAEVVIYRDENGMGQLEVVDTRATDEPNGTTIKIPTKPADNFTEKASKFYEYWDKGTVLVNGAEPAHISDDAEYTRLGSHYARPDKSRYGRQESSLTVVMGGVGYKTVMPQPEKFAVAIHVVSFVGIGDVDFVPSREALQMNGRTTKVVNDIWETVSERYRNHFTQGLAKAKTLPEAVALYLPMTHLLGRTPVDWKDIELTEMIPYPEGRSWSKSYYGRAGQSSTSRNESLYLSKLYQPSAARLVNRTSRASLNASDKFRLESYLKAKGLEAIETIYFNGPNLKVMSGMREIDWQDVLNETRTAVGPKTVTPKDEWEYYQSSADGSKIERHHGPLPTGVQVLYISTTEMVDKRSGYWTVRIEVLSAIAKVDPKTRPVMAMVNVNRQEKFKRDNVGALPVIPYVESFVKAQVKTFTEMELEGVAAGNVHVGYQQTHPFKALTGQTKDSHIDAIAAIMEEAKNKADKVNAIANQLRYVSGVEAGKDYITRTYPLVNTAHHLNHSIKYINHINHIKTGA